MYSVGESFCYEINDEEVELNIIGDVIIRGNEYIIAEDEDNNKFVFIYDDNEEDLIYIDDTEVAEELINSWQSEYYGTIDEVGLWEEEYEDEDEEELESSGDEYYMEDDDFLERDEDFDSYIDDLMDKDEDY